MRAVLHLCSAACILLAGLLPACGAPLPPACEPYSGMFSPAVHGALLPWAATGIDAATANATLHARSSGPHLEPLHGLQTHGLGFAFFGGTLHVLAEPRRFVRLVFAKYLIIYVAALLDVVAAHGPHLPDVEFVVQFLDSPDQLLSGPDAPLEEDEGARSVKASWSRPPLPVWRFCGSDDSANIGIPYAHFYQESFFSQLLGPVRGSSPPGDDPAAASFAPDMPWEQRSATAYANWMAYQHRFCETPVTQRAGVQGRRLECFRNETPRAVVAAWANSSCGAAACASGCGSGSGCGGPRHVTGAAAVQDPVALDVGAGNYSAMPDWARRRYIVHVDGAACSSKLEKSLALGSLVIKEESGLRPFYAALMQPFVHYVPFWRHRPQELLWALAWARANDEEAQRIAAAGRSLARRAFSPGALRCYWATLWIHYARLLRFRPGPPQRLYTAAVRAEEFLAEIERLAVAKEAPPRSDGLESGSQHEQVPNGSGRKTLQEDAQQVLLSLRGFRAE